MQKAKIKVYIKSKRRPLCTIKIDNNDIAKELFNNIVEQVKGKNVVIIGEKLVFRALEFKFATISYIKK